MISLTFHMASKIGHRWQLALLKIIAPPTFLKSELYMNVKNKFLSVLTVAIPAFSLFGCSTEDQEWFSSLASEATNYASAIAGGQNNETAMLNMSANVVNSAIANSAANATSTPIGAEKTYNTNTTATDGVTTHNVTISSEVAAVDLSGDCETAQAKGAAWANKESERAKARGPAICESAKDAERAGEIMVRVARACKNLPTWQQEEAAGIELINEAKETQSGSCT